MKTIHIATSLPTKHLYSRGAFGVRWQINCSVWQGRFVSMLLDIYEWLRETPLRRRLHKADKLSRKALRLRGETPTPYGWYEHSRGNEAARLAERAWYAGVDLWNATERSGEHSDKLEELDHALQTLAQMAGAAHYRSRFEAETESSN